MNLFINTISTNSFICIFDDNRNIISELYFNIQGNESSQLIPNLKELLDNNGLSFHNIKNIVIVNGPGSFTGVRSAVLIVNTIAFITNAKITPIGFFELFNNYPIIKQSSKRDLFFKKDFKSEIEIIENEKLNDILMKMNILKIYGEGNIKNIEIIEKINYSSIIKDIQLNNFNRIDPLYIKKPNIC